MGLLDQIAGGLLGQGAQQDGLLGSVSQLINQQGGLSGLVEKFQQGGLGDVVASWVGTGANQPISADQLQQVLGSGPLADIAGKLGVSPDEVGGHLAQLLPQVVDKLTPNGSIEQGGLLDQGLNVLKSGLLGG